MPKEGGFSPIIIVLSVIVISVFVGCGVLFYMNTQTDTVVDESPSDVLPASTPLPTPAPFIPAQPGSPGETRPALDTPAAGGTMPADVGASLSGDTQVSTSPDDR